MSTLAFPNCAPLALSDPEYDRLSSLVRATYPNACITMIDRITIPQAQEAFEEWRSRLPEGFKPEFTLFHGTKLANVSNICQYSFQVSEGRSMAYGYGIYFANSFRHSWLYTDSLKTDEEDSKMSYIFVTSVLPGRIQGGQANAQPSEGYHSRADNPAAPTIFAIPENQMMLPRYLIRFSKEAERSQRVSSAPSAPLSTEENRIDLMRYSREERRIIRQLQTVVKKGQKKSK